MKNSVRIMVSFIAAFALWHSDGRSAEVAKEYFIRDVLIYDGTGSPGKRGNLAIRGDRIVGVGNVTMAKKAFSIDGKNLVAAPGFIDLHNHSDLADDTSGSKEPALVLEKTRSSLNYLRQGV